MNLFGRREIPIQPESIETPSLIESQDDDIDGIPIKINDESVPLISSIVEKTHERVTSSFHPEKRNEMELESIEEDIDGIPIPVIPISYEKEDIDGVPI